MENLKLLVHPGLINFQTFTNSESSSDNSRHGSENQNFSINGGNEMRLLEFVLEDIETQVSGDSEETNDKLIEIFCKHATKRELRKRVLHFLASDPKYFSDIVKSSVAKIVKHVNTTSICHVTYCQRFVYFTDTCLPAVKEIGDDIIKQILCLCIMLLEIYLCQKRSSKNCDFLNPLINSSCRLMLSLYSKKNSVEYPGIAEKLFKYSYDIISSDGFEFELRKKCGLIFVSSFHKIPREEKKLKNESIPLLGCHFSNIDDSSFIDLLLDVEASQSVKTILYTCVYSTVDALEIYEDKLPIITSVYDLLIHSATRVTGITEEIVEISKTLTQMTKYFCRFKSDEFVLLFEKGLNHVWAFIDHTVHFVRNYTKEFFISLIQNATEHYKSGNESCINLLLTKVKNETKISNIYFFALESLTKSLGTSFVLKEIPDAAIKLMKMVYDFTIGLQASNAYIEMMRNHYSEIAHENWISVWIKPVVISLRSSVSPITERLENIIISGCRIFPKMLHVLFPQDHEGDMKDSATLLKCLRFARLLKPTEKHLDGDNLWKGLIHTSKLDLFLTDQNDQIRISVLSVIVESRKTTELYTEYDIEFLMRYIKYNIAAGTPSTRKQMISLYKKALARFDAGYKVIVREVANSKKRNDNILLEHYEHKGKLYKDFIILFIKDLISNLYPGANFQRRSASMELLLVAEACVSNEEWDACWDKHDIKNLFSILHDSYESNKVLAVNLLEKFSLEKLCLNDRETTTEYFEKCLELACHIKPINTLSAAYMFLVVVRASYIPSPMNTSSVGQESRNGRILAIKILLEKLSATLKDSSDVLLAATSKPLHGILLCIYHLLVSRNKNQQNEIYREIFTTVADLTRTILDIVNPIIFNQSPEGYFPKCDVLDNIDQTSTSQLLLFYAWRTMKELTILISEIIIQSCQVKDTVLLSVEYIHTLVEEFINIFIQSKHRGVFEHSFVGFSAICAAFWRSDDAVYNNLPKKWLTRTLNYCTGKEKSPHLCSTRRSAGLPFLLLSIVTTYPYINKNFMDEVMTPLMDSSKHSHDDDESKTHCLNTLRAVFRNTKLGDHVSPYIVDAVKTAVLGFSSPSWSVRNSSTLLYSALIVRMFGVQRTQDPDDLTMKNKLTVKVFIMRYPTLLEFLFDTLRVECRYDEGRSLLLHPTLVILSRLCPSHIDDITDKSDKAKYISLIDECLSHPIYKTRELAAKASLAFLSPDDLPLTIKEKFKATAKEFGTSNTCSGYLLQLNYLLKRSHIEDPKVVDECIMSSVEILKFMGVANADLAVTLYMDALRRLLLGANGYTDSYLLSGIMKIISQRMENESSVLMRYSYNKSRLLLLLVVCFKIFKHSVSMYKSMKQEVLFYLYNNNDIEMKRFCLKLLICLSQDLFKDTATRHPLLEYEQVEVPTEITEMLNIIDDASKLSFYLQVRDDIIYYCLLFMKNMESTSEDLVESLLLCSHYPCFISYQKSFGPSEIFESLLELIQDKTDYEAVSVILSCLQAVLLKSDEDQKREMNIKALIHTLKVYSSPSSPEYLRLVICHFLKSFGLLRFRECPNIKEQELCDIFDIIMILLEDDDLNIRNAISHINSTENLKERSHFHHVPEIAREELFQLALKCLPKYLATGFIIAWSTKAFEVEDNNLSEIFDRSELNQYADSVAVVKAAVPVLQEAIWEEVDMSSDAAIRQTILVGTNFILMSVDIYKTKMIGHETLVELSFVLKHLITFIENCDENKDIRSELSLFLTGKIRAYFVRHSSYSHSIMNYLLLKIYKPIVNIVL